MTTQMPDRFDPSVSRAANPLIPPICERSRIQGLEAQVEDLKYTLNNVLQCFVAALDVAGEDRHAALVEDARAALKTQVADYLG
jgi:hypothetical protein